MGSRIALWMLAILSLLALAVAAGAAPPEDVTYQGRLLDPGGDPVAGPVTVAIGVWDQPTGGTQLYGETHSGVALVDGVFDLLLGTGTVVMGSFDAELFAAQNRYLEVTVDGEVLTPRQPFSSVAYALQSGQAESVGGVTSSSLVTVDNLEATFASEVSEVSDAQIPAAITRDTELQVVETQVTSLEGENASQQAEIAALQSQLVALQAMLAGVTRNGDTLVFSGMNVQVVSGSGATDADVNGLGNLIVGYNELRGDGTDDRSGSHNVVVGRRHSYSSYGGFASGQANNILGAYAAVTGGQVNTASGAYSSVTGGLGNTASGLDSSVSGGEYNDASGSYSSVTGGSNNTASGDQSSVSGGHLNTASRPSSSVSGGSGNTASASGSSVSGGSGNTASGTASSVSGGHSNEASVDYSSVSGGESNIASGSASSVSGGSSNTAAADYASVSGGLLNWASGAGASVSGGSSNAATATSSSVSGGYDNLASNAKASVSGGEFNKACGEGALVSGGNGNHAGGRWTHLFGGLNCEDSIDFDWTACIGPTAATICN